MDLKIISSIITKKIQFEIMFKIKTYSFVLINIITQYTSYKNYLPN